MMKVLTHNIQQEREDQRDRSAQLFMWCIVVSMHQDDGIGASRLLRACNEMDAFEKKYQTAILYGSSKNATDAMRENLKGICDFEVRLQVDRAPRGRREELAEELDTLGDYAYSYRIGDSVMGMTVKSYSNLMSAAARCLRKGADNAGKE